jgi:hypothetical protein
MKHGTYIMHLSPSEQQASYTSHQPICPFVYVHRQWLSKNITTATNTYETIEELLHISVHMRPM